VGILFIIVVLALTIIITCKRYFPWGVSEQHLLHKTVQDSSYAAGLSSELVTNASRFSSLKDGWKQGFKLWSRLQFCHDPWYCRKLWTNVSDTDAIVVVDCFLKPWMKIRINYYAYMINWGTWNWIYLFIFIFGVLISGYVSEAEKLGREDLPTCRSYSLEELKEATNNFDNSTFMGENIYGKVMSKTNMF